MSRLRADKLVNRAATGAPQLTYGASIPVGYGLTGAGGINITGVATAGSFSGALTGNVTGNVTGNINSSGISTLGNTVVGGGTTQLVVTGNARITGILTIGTSSITLDGSSNQVNVGTGVTLHHTNGVQVGGNTLHSTVLTVNNINASGVVTATSFSGSGANLTGIGATTDVRTNSLVVSGMTTATGGLQVGVTTSITVGSSFIKNNAVGLGTTDTTGRNAGVGTAAGTLIFNSSVGAVQFYTGNVWVSIVAGTATGGDVSAGVAPGNGFRYHVFTSPGSFTVSGSGMNIDMLVVAGGGGGGGGMNANNHGGGGGGAGGIAQVTSMPLVSGTYSVTVANSAAAGGTGQIPTQAPVGATGSDSSVVTPHGTVTAKGGGGGGTGPGSVSGKEDSGRPGGCSGGSGAYDTANAQPATQPSQNPGNPFVTNFGNPGGSGGSSSSDAAGGGGGGTGSAGSGTPGSGGGGSNTGGAGGNGQPFPTFAFPLISPIVPSPYSPEMGPAVGPTGLYGGGGGGGSGGNHPTSNQGSGGPGGGMPGGATRTAGGNGRAGTGGGGGGGGGGGDQAGGNGGNGGQGVVIIRYQQN